jgi:hypothetical protein
MVALGRSMTEILVDEYGPDEFVKRIGDPVWFQSLGTVLAFDWNASGLTTILTAALKEAIRGQEKDLGIFICGGKGKTSLKTPDEIRTWGQRLNLPQKRVQNLVYNSKMSAKVDSSLIQDDYQIYHHAFFFSGKGAWTVVQQGMNTKNQTARRYHWHSQRITDMVCEPHSGIATQIKRSSCLNLTAKESTASRKVSAELVLSPFNSLENDLSIIRRHASSLSKMISLKQGHESLTLLKLSNEDFRHHPMELENFFESKYLKKIFQKLCYLKPPNYEALLATEGVGPKTVRALALVAEIIYGARASLQDPARYSFAHGGKDAIPYPVDTETYDKTIEVLMRAVRKSKIMAVEKNKAIARLARLASV